MGLASRWREAAHGGCLRPDLLPLVVVLLVDVGVPGRVLDVDAIGGDLEMGLVGDGREPRTCEHAPK
jgi:hypothetical protein